MVRRFSLMASIVVPVIVATGVAQTLKLAGNLDDVTSTSWGRTLLVKVAVVTVLIAIGGVSQWLLRNDGPSALKRNVLVEALIGIGVIGLAAALVALPPQTVAVSKVFTNTLTNQGVIADVTVTPGRVGQNEVHLVITPPGGSLDPVVSTSVQATFAFRRTGAGDARIDRAEPLHRHHHAVDSRRLEPADHRRTHAGPVRAVELGCAHTRLTTSRSAVASMHMPRKVGRSARSRPLKIGGDAVAEVVLVGDCSRHHRSQGSTDGDPPGGHCRDQGARHLRGDRLHLRPFDVVGERAHGAGDLCRAFGRC